MSDYQANGVNKVASGNDLRNFNSHGGYSFKDKMDEASYFNDHFEHIQMELERLDLYIRRYVYLFRKSIYINDNPSFKSPGYISNEEIDELLNQVSEPDYDDESLNELNIELHSYDKAVDTLSENSLKKNIFLPLLHIARLFNLSWLEYQVLIACLGSELCHRYDKFYAYLQDDLARKKPSVDFVLNLFVTKAHDRWQARSLLLPGATLLKHALLETCDDPHSPSGASSLAKFLKLDSRILNYILGNNEIDSRLEGILEIQSPVNDIEPIVNGKKYKQELLDVLQSYLKTRSGKSKNLIIHLSGSVGVGKKTILSSICSELSCPLLVLDIEKLRSKNDRLELLLKLAFRESLLAQGALYIDNIDCLLDDSIEARIILKYIDYMVNEYGWISFIGSAKNQRLMNVFKYNAYHYSEIDMPDEPTRCLLWEESLQKLLKDRESIDRYAMILAQRYILSVTAIKAACESAQLMMLGKQSDIVNLEDLMMICRSQSGHGLSAFAKKVKPHYAWEDLILPDDIKLTLKNICHQVQNENTVFKEWNFSEKLQYGRGLSVLYSGPPGTGKTMSAQVIANELQIDLYKIDLSGVVSKYIGETEKNLNRIFEQAENCNAILFFDEADALFGKRTEVSDAHDRYANIEVSYLLQKMEEYSGIVILATNFRNNMDNAFTRRIRFIIEFPFPDAKSRLQIWKKNIPEEAPLGDDVDFEYLSNRVKVSGANIKNIVLNAAFYAAQHGRNIDMQCLSYSIEQEYRKIGKLWVEDNISNTKQENNKVSIKHD